MKPGGKFCINPKRTALFSMGLVASFAVVSLFVAPPKSAPAPIPAPVTKKTAEQYCQLDGQTIGSTPAEDQEFQTRCIEYFNREVEPDCSPFGDGSFKGGTCVGVTPEKFKRLVADAKAHEDLCASHYNVDWSGNEMAKVCQQYERMQHYIEDRCPFLWWHSC
jgi:hypothetical protein